ncbi:MAG: beta-propeller domain-containing protein [Lachnospiraceae bacterium]|nr:beta-propeller domain-containing protein [Lachnospiraceae bacterium]
MLCIKNKWYVKTLAVLTALSITGLPAAVQAAASVPELPAADSAAEAAADTAVSSAAEMPSDDAGESEELHENVTPETISYASSWDDIYEALKRAENHYYYYDEVDYAVEEKATADMSYEADIAAAADVPYVADTAAGVSKDYSDTNLRDQKVDEGDIVKTDGNYIYILQQSSYLTIVRADAENSDVVSRSRISLSVNANDSTGQEETALISDEQIYSSEPQAMFVQGDRLILIVSEQRYRSGSTAYWNTDLYTRVITLDISDRSNPAVLGTYLQEGSYQQARRINGITYLYTTRWPDIGYSCSESELAVRIGDRTLEPADYCIPAVVTDQSYLLFSSVSDADPSAVLDCGVFVSGGSQFYVSSENLYVLNSYWGRSDSKTQITRFSLKDGQITGEASCSLAGYVNNTWSIDEYQGNLRVLLTYSGLNAADVIGNLLRGQSLSTAVYNSETMRRNVIFILDKNLERIARLGNIAENEEIKSARFMGDTAYFVTYRNTDPLFCMDLSDPKQPKILGYLKISGFSAYLHPFGENKLLGVGYETDAMTGNTLGLKLTMFDTSVQGDLKVIDSLVIPGITYCPAIENYKSILAAPEKGLIGFYYSDRYLLYSYHENEGFAQFRNYDLLSTGLAGSGDETTMRGLYIGDEMYLAGSTYVAGFSLNGDTDKEFILKTDA